MRGGAATLSPARCHAASPLINTHVQVPHRYPALFGDSLGARLLREAMGNRDPACVACKTWTTFFADE